MFSNPKSIQASVTLLEKLPVILDKSTEEDMRNLVLPLLFNSLESKMSQIQVCNVTCLTQSIWYHMQGYVYFRFDLILLYLPKIIFSIQSVFLWLANLISKWSIGVELVFLSPNCSFTSLNGRFFYMTRARVSEQVKSQASGRAFLSWSCHRCTHQGAFSSHLCLIQKVPILPENLPRLLLSWLLDTI